MYNVCSEHFLSRKEDDQASSLSGFLPPSMGGHILMGSAKNLSPARNQSSMIIQTCSKKPHVNSFTGCFGMNMFSSSYPSKPKKRPTPVKGVWILSGQVYGIMDHYLLDTYSKFQVSPISIDCTTPQIALKNAEIQLVWTTQMTVYILSTSDILYSMYIPCFHPS